MVDYGYIVRSRIYFGKYAFSLLISNHYADRLQPGTLPMVQRHKFKMPHQVARTHLLSRQRIE